MKTLSIRMIFILWTLLLASNTWAGEIMQMTQVAAANPCSIKHNPCGMKKHNPCNPCGKKAANPCNPCAGKAARIDPKLITRPAGAKIYAGLSRSKLVKQGRKLFSDASLSSNGLSCNSCHSTNHLFNATFAKPYPHPVSMAKERAGVTSRLNADEFVQFCMLAPMASKPLPWESKSLAALTAYVTDIKQPAFVEWAVKNPCALKKKMAAANPCGMKMHNPCNPCGMKSGMKMHNPCNPCGKKMHNPCNPCGMKKDMKMHNPCDKKMHNPCNPCAKKMHNPCGGY